MGGAAIAKKLLLLTVVGALAACASVDFDRYEGREAIQTGVGGTKSVNEGVEIWSFGNPPRKYEILGVATITVGNGPATNSMIRSSVTSKVKESGGNAAILMDSGPSGPSFGFGQGIVGTNTAIGFGGASKVTARYLIVKYVEQ